MFLAFRRKASEEVKDYPKVDEDSDDENPHEFLKLKEFWGTL